MEPKIDDLVTASRLREAGLRSRQSGLAKVGWYRGEQSRAFEIYKLLKKWGHVRIAARLLKHYGMSKEDGSFGG